MTKHPAFAPHTAASALPTAGDPSADALEDFFPDNPFAADPVVAFADTPLAFLPVPMQRRRAKGWTPLRQARFIEALEVTCSVEAAARMCGMGRGSAYRLRDRPGAESFARAWDMAIDSAQQWAFTVALDRALNGVTTVRVMRGGAVEVTGGHDNRLCRAALRSLPPAPEVPGDDWRDRAMRRYARRQWSPSA